MFNRPRLPLNPTSGNPAQLPNPLTLPGAPNQNALNPNVVNDPTRFVSFNSLNLTVLSGRSALLLNESPNLRVFLCIRNAVSSAGFLLIGFGSDLSENTASYVLNPGGYAFFDQTVPQNQIYAGGYLGAVQLVATFANVS